jgi:hypothetical protein
MRTVLLYCRSLLTGLLLFFSCSCDAADHENGLVLTGSTAGDPLIKRMLKIPAQTAVDFIRWNLVLQDDHQFSLDIQFGESQPNTLGFKNGGVKNSFTGSYTVTASDHFKVLYRLSSSDLPGMIALVKISENVFHLLNAQGEFMNGNGGWSYSLNRHKTVEPNTILIKSSGKEDQSARVIYEGRTPCREIAAEHPEMKVSPACFKLKWQLVLNRDPVTFLPTTFMIRKIIDGKAQNVSGKWIIQKGTGINQGQVIYIIEPDKPAESISFLVADRHVLFFLNKQQQPYVGNADFGFALNRKL